MQPRSANTSQTPQGAMPLTPAQMAAGTVPYVVPTQLDTAGAIAFSHPTLAGGVTPARPLMASPPTVPTIRPATFAGTQAPIVSSAPNIASSVQRGAATAPPARTNTNSTQNMLQFAEIRDGIIIMNDGSFRSVIMLKSINFDLMSQGEQEAVEYSFQGFLNSLFFPIQIFIRSQKIDLQVYIDRLDKRRGKQDNMLLGMLTEDYIGFISDLAQQSNIMDKKFYVVVPYFPKVDVQKALTNSKNFVTGLVALFNTKEQHVVINEADLEKAKTELRNRVQSVLSGMQQCGVQGLPLDTQELIELLYDTYNPDTATRQQMKNFGRLDADIVTKAQGPQPEAG
ncbi:MAG TPA: hypothetical protein VGS08_01900 [Candidatus Saccharimonadales bacterium]|nr:hypothetical protein [Candidatus Saccharimonadales bacterium]